MILARLKTYALALFAVLAAIAGALLYGRRKGKQAEQANTRAAQDAAAVAVDKNEKMESRHETDVAVERLPDAPAGVSIGDAPRDTSAGKLSSWAD
jgi:hypothetical protein